MIRRLAILVPVVLLLLVGAGYTGFWYFAAGQMHELVDTWFASWRHVGIDARHGPMQRAGFPGTVRLTIPAPAIASLEQGWAWSTDDATLSMRPWDLTAYRIDMPGQHTFTAPQSDGSRQFFLHSSAASGIAKIALGGQLERLELKADQVALAADSVDGVGYMARELALRVVLPDTPPRVHTDPVGDVTLVLDELKIPEHLDGPFGTAIDRFRIDAEMRGALPAGPLAESLQSWREAGGTVELKWLHLAWGPIDLKLKGTLALDAELRPIGALSADIAGFAEAINVLIDAGLVERDTGRLARAGLGLLAKRPEGGGPPVLSVPMTAQNGKLFLGPIAITTLPPIVKGT